MTPNCWYNFGYGVNCTFFNVLHVPKNTTKQLKLKDPSRELTPMRKLDSEIKVCSMHKIISLYLYLGYVPI
jgi:hypothetical protein